jgi:radical SAM protein with 4Fe4S-binding SPASM domain
MAMIERNLESILAAARDAKVRLTTTPQTCSLLPMAVEYFVQRGFRRVCFYHASEAAWDPAALRALRDVVRALGDVYVDGVVAGQAVLDDPIDRYLRRIVERERRETRDDPLCGAGRTDAAVGLDGEIYACQRFASARGFRGSLPIGHVGRGIDPRLRAPFLRSTHAHLLGCDIECCRCSIRGFCSGGCMAANYASSGHVMQAAPQTRLLDMIYVSIARSIREYFRGSHREEFQRRFGLQADAGSEMLEETAAAAGTRTARPVLG